MQMLGTRQISDKYQGSIMGCLKGQTVGREVLSRNQLLIKFERNYANKLISTQPPPPPREDISDVFLPERIAITDVLCLPCEKPCNLSSIILSEYTEGIT